MVSPRIGIGYRHSIGDRIRAHLDRLDVIEVTVDHYLYGGSSVRAAIETLARCVPIVAHGVRLSLGTDGPLDTDYVREVAGVVRRLGASRYSEHLAFTKVSGLDLGNLLPLPKTRETAAWIADKVGRVRALLPVPLDLENITYLFDWPDSSMSDGAFLRVVCEATGAGLLLDVENLYVNACNHGFDADAVLAEIPVALVRGMHMAGGSAAGGVLVDSHDRTVRDGTLDLLGRALARFRPDTVILERDDRIEAFDEILADIARIRACPIGRRENGARHSSVRPFDPGRPAAAVPLIERQRALLAFLTNPRAAPGAALLAGFDSDRLRLMRDLSVEKRLDKVRSSFAVTLAHLDEPMVELCADFAATFPPHDIGRAENALQFGDFLSQRWARSPPRSAYLPDLMQLELALTLARRHIEGGREPAPDARPAIRRRAGAQFLHCRYDVRPLFDPSADAREPIVRDLYLVVLPPNPDDQSADASPRVIEISAELHAALLGMQAWLPLGIGAPADVTERLVGLGILEVAA